MANNLQTSSEPSLTSLVTGIIHDGQELLKQQLTLFKTELREDLRHTREAGTSLAIGGVVLFVGSILLCLMLVFLLHELAGWPLWASFLLVGGVITVIGGALTAYGIQQFKSFNPLPDQTAEGLKENLEWTTKPR
jgi:VIT1/CCC1 family predicted Fe2+/Mn2+ transporter